jgi:outer membrane protein OmpA-like peptidoglycan-associated protein
MLDFDKDGVADNLDKCPNTPAGIPVDSTGCPMDFDKDGVADYLDKCPNTQRGAEVGPNGCMLDSDKDGIADFKDKCPGTPAGHAVDSTGCLPDFDKDGVADIIDKCPNTLPGIRVDGEGCPINKKEDLDQLKKGIQFKTGSAKLTKNSYSTLNDIADLMNKIPEANLEVQGHTDNKGSDAKNQKLSESRAQAVVAYLQKRGVNSDRLRAVGYGPSKPIADNSDAAGRAQNRRVELVPFAK